MEQLCQRVTHGVVCGHPRNTHGHGTCIAGVATGVCPCSGFLEAPQVPELTTDPGSQRVVEGVEVRHHLSQLPGALEGLAPLVGPDRNRA